MDSHDVELPAHTDSARRRLIGSLLAGGLAAVVAPKFIGSASAAGTPRATIPNVDLLNQAYDLEKNMVATYAATVEVTAGQDDRPALLLIHEHHVAYAQALKAYLGSSASTAAGRSLSSPSGAIASDANRLAALEQDAVNAHLAILAQLEKADAASLISSIVTVEARHVAALTLVGGGSVAAAAGL